MYENGEIEVVGNVEEAMRWFQRRRLIYGRRREEGEGRQRRMKERTNTMKRARKKWSSTKHVGKRGKCWYMRLCRWKQDGSKP